MWTLTDLVLYICSEHVVHTDSDYKSSNQTNALVRYCPRSQLGKKPKCLKTQTHSHTSLPDVAALMTKEFGNLNSARPYVPISTYPLWIRAGDAEKISALPRSDLYKELEGKIEWNRYLHSPTNTIVWIETGGKLNPKDLLQRWQLFWGYDCQRVGFDATEAFKSFSWLHVFNILLPY